MNKYDYTKNPVVDNGSRPLTPYPSLYEENIMQGEDFLGRFLQLRSSPSKNFGESQTIGKIWYDLELKIIL